jgi:hypothetical protein
MATGRDCRALARLVLIIAPFAGAACAADAPLRPVTVCEILAQPSQYEGAAVAVLGKFSFREAAGRFIAEDGCESRPASTSFRVVFDAKGGPKPPAVLEVEAAALNRKLEAVKRRTPLGKFRFGSLDYDRWAVVYGRVEVARAVPARVVCHGEAAIVFLPEE